DRSPAEGGSDSNISLICCLRSSNRSSGIYKAKKQEGSFPSSVPHTPASSQEILGRIEGEKGSTHQKTLFYRRLMLMTVVRRFTPLNEALTLHDAMNQLLAQSFVQPEWRAGRSSSLAAPIDVFESEQTYHVHVLLPRVAPEDIELTVQGNTL